MALSTSKLERFLTNNAWTLWNLAEEYEAPFFYAVHPASARELRRGRIIRRPCGAGDVVIYLNDVTGNVTLARDEAFRVSVVCFNLLSKYGLRSYFKDASDALVAEYEAAKRVWAPRPWDEISDSDWKKMERRSEDAPEAYFRH